MSPSPTEMTRVTVAVGRQRGLTITSPNVLKLAGISLSGSIYLHPLILEPINTIGIVIKSDPLGSYRPSRVLDLIVDGEPRAALFQLREAQSTLQWEIKPAV